EGERAARADEEDGDARRKDYGMGRALRLRDLGKHSAERIRVRPPVAADYRERRKEDERGRERNPALAGVLSRLAPWGAEKHDLPEAEHVEGGQHGRQRKDPEHRGI